MNENSANVSEMRSSTFFGDQSAQEQQRKLREQKIGRMMSQMSTNYPVMQILGYQKMDARSNMLISE